MPNSNRKAVDPQPATADDDAAIASGDVTPIIHKLLKAADAASRLDSPAGFVAVRGLLAEAARLTLTAPRAVEAQPSQRRHLTDEEWLAKYAPETLAAEGEA